MKTLPPLIERNGFSYTQVLRGQRSCLYAQKVSEQTVFYEVFLIKIKPARIIFENKICESEAFPHNEAFGYWAWSFRSFEAALKRFIEIEGRGQ